MSEEIASLKDTLKAMNLAFSEKLKDLKDINEAILERVEDLTEASANTRSNQARTMREHEKMIEQVDTVFATVNNSMNSLALQVRDLRDALKKDDSAS